MKTLNELMKELQVCVCVAESVNVIHNTPFHPPSQAHPFLQPVEYIHYLSDRKQVIIVQPFREQGSLKDLIYNVTQTQLVVQLRMY